MVHTLTIVLISLLSQARADYEEHIAYYVELLSSYEMPGGTLMEHPTLAKGEHVVSGFKNRTMVIGHRGGSFGPENSLKTFRGAVENGLEGIEFDVSV